MKNVLLFSILLCVITLPSFAELTPQDLEKFRSVVKEEIEKEIKTMRNDIVTLEFVDSFLKKFDILLNRELDDIQKQVDGIQKQMVFLLVFFIVAVATPQIIIVLRNRKDRDQERINRELRQEIEALKQKLIINSE